MTAFFLKIIAVLAMVVDHTAYVFVPGSSVFYFPMRIIGRLTMPIMCFFAAEGVRKTRNIRKYLIRLFVFALLSEMPFRLLLRTRPPQIWMPQNVIFTLFFAVLALALGNRLEEKGHRPYLRLLPYGAACVLLGWFDTDYFWFGALLVFAFYHGKTSEKKQLLYLLAAYAAFLIGEVTKGLIAGDPVIPLLNVILELPSLCALPLLARYNGVKGGPARGARYLFYVFYPLHMVVLYLIYVITHIDFGGLL